MVCGQWSNIPLGRIAYWPKCTVDYWSVSNSFKSNHWANTTK